MSKELINSTKDFLADRAWGASVAVTMNMKQGKRYEDPEGKLSGSFYVPLDEYRINQNLRHFLNLLNTACFGNNWRRNNKRLNVVCVKIKNTFMHVCLDVDVIPRRRIVQLCFRHVVVKTEAIIVPWKIWRGL